MSSNGRAAFSLPQRDRSLHIPPLGTHNRSQVNTNITSTTSTSNSNYTSGYGDHVFKRPLLTTPNSPMKRKPSKSELNPVSKVHLRRQSNSFENNNNNNTYSSNDSQRLPLKATTPLTEKSQQKSSEQDSNTEALSMPALILAPFEPAPWLEFGKVVVGAKKTMSLMVENPTDRVERLSLDPSCKMEEKGFNISQLDPILLASRNSSSPQESIILQPRSKVEIDICWTPLSAGSVRASAILKTSNGRFMVNLRGRGDFPVPEYQGLQNSKNPLAMSTRSVKDSTNIGSSSFNPKASALKQSIMRQSVLRNDLSSSTTQAPGGYSTLPYVTTNDMYDEKWIDKQERSFSQWLNYEFNVIVDEFSPKDRSSWSYYSHKLEFEHTRASACKIYQSDTFRIVLRKVEDSIARDRLQIRADVNLVGDIGVRREIMDLIFSFDIRWLVLGLETITGKETAMSPNFDRATISGFINRAIFHDKQLADEFDPDRILSNRPKFNQAMNRLILKRIFMLILFLDKAKMARLIPSDPCLFNKSSEVKSCRAILLIISKNYLMGEGDIIRHLLFMGYSVTHTQSPLDEYDFMVKNLAVDLRDGVRLCRLADLHCPDLGLSAKMKFPTLSKAHMQQNVSLALNALVGQGIALEGTRGGVVGSRDIVEGHREKTFGLLWKLILNWKVSVLVDLSVLEAEISALKQEYRRVFGVEQPERVDTVYFTSDQLSALLRWCQAIGAFYNLSIDNFTTSFSDGRGFGAMLSYYHPTLLDMSSMKDSAKYLEEYKQGLHQPELQPPVGNDGKGWFIDSRDVTDPITQAKEMDRFNYRLLQSKIQALGGVPITLRHADMSNVGVPDEKAVILFVTYLCARLMHLNKDIRAAKTIQRIWRKKRYGRKEESRVKATLVLQKHIRRHLAGKRVRDISEKREAAALLIQTGCRLYLAQVRAIHKLDSVITIQTQCRGILARRRLLEHQWAALTIQRYYRGHAVRLQYHKAVDAYRVARAIQAQASGYLVRKQFLLLRIAAEVIQSRRRAYVEGELVRQKYRELAQASVVIQRQWRATVAARKVRTQFLQQRTWATKIQAQVRSKLVRLDFLGQVWAATVIQRHMREYRLRKKLRHRFLEQRWAASVIQARWRAVVAGRQVQRQYQQLHWAAVKIQSVVRSHFVRQQYLEIKNAALVLQRRRRALVECRQQEGEFLQMRSAAIVIQSHWRAVLAGREVRRQYNEHRSMVVRFQAAIRGHVLRKRLLRVFRENQACMAIQKSWKGYVQRKAYRNLKAATICIQRSWRAVLLRRQERHLFQEYQWAAIVAQRWWRAQVDGRQMRHEFLKYKQAAIVIQSAYRGLVARREALALRTIVRTQATVRARYVRWQFERLRAAAIVVQRQWRARQSGLEQRAAYETMVSASLVIQRRWRAVQEGRRVREQYLSTRALIVATQSHIRGAMVRKSYLELKSAAVIIQQAWRARVLGRQQRQAYETQWLAARAIQTTWRSVQLTRLQRHAFLDLRWASIIFQRQWREILDRRAMNRELEAQRKAMATMLQAAVRGCLVRNRVRVHLENRERLVGQWIDLSTLSLSAICIQRAWRRHVDRQLLELRTTAATMIQRWWRQCQEDRQVHQLEVLTFMMQTQIRGVLARQRFARQKQAVLYLQSFWRGHVVRKECTAKIKAARKRIEHANATAEEHMKLGNRTTMALDILLSSGQLSAVLKACYHLDVVTRLSKNSCLRLVEHNVINIIFQLIKSCNRSQPHMEVLKHGLNIIENLSRDPDTTVSVFWAPDGMEILVDCAQAYRENEMVFESVVTILLLHLEDDENRRRIMRGMTPEVKKLKGVLTVMERKVEREGRGAVGSSNGNHRPSMAMSTMGHGSSAVASGKGASTRTVVSSVVKLRRIVELLK